jgi:hypothetical protein
MKKDRSMFPGMTREACTAPVRAARLHEPARIVRQAGGAGA